MIKLNKFYIFNFSLVLAFFLAVFLSFAVQFKVESLQDKIVKGEIEISAFDEQIKMLEVEWSYLTRPSRLRDLAQEYLDGGYSVASQVKAEGEMMEFYLANYEKAGREFAANF